MYSPESVDDTYQTILLLFARVSVLSCFAFVYKGALAFGGESCNYQTRLVMVSGAWDDSFK